MIQISTSEIYLTSEDNWRPHIPLLTVLSVGFRWMSCPLVFSQFHAGPRSKPGLNSCRVPRALLCSLALRVFQSRRLSHKIPLKARSLLRRQRRVRRMQRRKLSFLLRCCSHLPALPPLPLPPSRSPLFQCIHADLYRLYPPLPSFLPSALLHALNFIPSSQWPGSPSRRTPR